MLRICLCIILLCGVSGCGGNQSKDILPETVPVSGVVTMNGTPLASAMVVFIPTGSTKGTDCQGMTDASGKFTLKQHQGADGAPVGNYKVVVSLVLTGDGKPPTGDAAGGAAIESLPKQYSDKTRTILKADVPASGGEFKFDLKSKKKK